MGNYLDKNVSLERQAFHFPKKLDEYENNLIYPFSKTCIESKAAQLTNQFFSEDILSRKKEKNKRIDDYVINQAPWYKSVINDLQTDELPYDFTEEQLDQKLYEARYKQERAIKKEIDHILNDGEEINEAASKILEKITDLGKSDLVHYVALRKTVLDYLKKYLCLNEENEYSKENMLHNLIFPLRKDSDTSEYEKHNLWILDERLNFTEYLASDLPLEHPRDNRPDIVAYGNRYAYRGDNDTPSNPITILSSKDHKEMILLINPQKKTLLNKSLIM
jgi:hypothetical protein